MPNTMVGFPLEKLSDKYDQKHILDLKKTVEI